MDPAIKHCKIWQSHIQKLKIWAILKFNSTLVELGPNSESKFMARFIEPRDGCVWIEKGRTDGDVEEVLHPDWILTYIWMFHAFLVCDMKSFCLDHNMCLFDVSHYPPLMVVCQPIHKGLITHPTRQHQLDGDDPKFKLDGMRWSQWQMLSV